MEDTKKLKTHFCEYCNFETRNKTDYAPHILPSEHTKNVEGYNNDTEKTHDTTNNSFGCNCGKVSKHHSGLWRDNNDRKLLRSGNRGSLLTYANKLYFLHIVSIVSSKMSSKNQLKENRISLSAQ